MLLITGAAKADTQFPPAGFSECVENFTNPFTYDGPGDSTTLERYAKVCEASASSARAYTGPVPEYQKQALIGYSWLCASILWDGPPLNQEERALSDANASLIAFQKARDLDPVDDDKVALQAIIKVIKQNLPRLSTKI